MIIMDANDFGNGLTHNKPTDGTTDTVHINLALVGHNATDDFNTTITEIPRYYTQWQVIVIICTISMMILGTMIGNAIVCISVGLVTQLRRHISNLLLVSLAISDLLVAIFVMPFALVNEVMEIWYLGFILCDVYTFLDVMLCTASILNLCAISIDRYLLVEHPFWYSPKRTRSVLIGIAMGTWTLAFIISIPPILGWKSEKDRQLIRQGVCLISQDIGYQIYATSVAFYIPLFIMLGVYTRIYIIAERICNSPTATRRDRTNMKHIKTLGVIMGTFIACWLPFFIMAVIRPFCIDCIPRWINGLFQWLGYVNSLFNPLIYAVCHKDFRQPFKDMLCCRWRGINRRARSFSFGEQWSDGTSPQTSSHKALLNDTHTITTSESNC